MGGEWLDEWERIRDKLEGPTPADVMTDEEYELYQQHLDDPDWVPETEEG